MRIAVAFLTAVALLTASCGYRTNSGTSSAVAPGVKTIAVPAFKNKTETFKVEQQITQAVISEMISRTRFKVVYDENSAADATLRGTITQTELSPLTYDSQTGRASSAIVVVHANVSLVDSHGKTLFSNPNFIFRDQYQVSREISSFFAEDQPAIERLSRDFARTLVADLLESY